MGEAHDGQLRAENAQLRRQLEEHRHLFAAEQALRANEAILRSFYESSPLLMGVVELADGDDDDIHHVYDNPATDRFFRRPVGSTAGTGACALGVPAAVIAQWVRHYRESQTRGAPVVFEYAHQRPEGTVWLSVIVTCAGRADAGRTRFTYVVEDATERREAQERLRASEERLRAADRRKDEFLAMLAHELRNPLAPLKSGIAVLERAAGRPGVIQATREMMARQVDQLVRLIDDLLEVSRITQGKLELRKGRVGLSSVLQQAIETARPAELEERRLELSLQDPALYVDGDAARLAQVFGNLIGNAYRFSRPGQRIAVRAAREGAEAIVSVRDEGVGIAPDDLERVFEMFAQIESEPAGSGGYAGLGIGLALVRKLVELHGGTVSVCSEGRGKGAEFIVRLPAADAPPAPSARAAPQGVVAERILIVDDNGDAAESLALLLQLDGCRTLVARDGWEALDAGGPFAPDVVLLDISMPGIDGFETCRRMRALDWGRRARVIALTGYGQDQDRRKSAQSGFDAHLVKPVSIEELAALLSTPSMNGDVDVRKPVR